MDKQTKLEFDIKRSTTFTLEDVDMQSSIKLHVTFIDEQKDLHLLETWLSWGHKQLGLDIETTGLVPHTDKLIMFQIGDLERQFVIDTRKVDISGVLPLIFNDEITLVGHNLKFEYSWIKEHYAAVLHKVKDTMLQEVVLYNGLGLRNSLKEVALRYLNYEPDKTIRMRFLTIEDKPFSKDEIIYGAYDVVLPLLISAKQEIKLKEFNMTKVMELEHLYLPVLGDMELNGLNIDTKKWTELYYRNLEVLKQALKDLDQYIIDNNFTEYIDNQYDLFSDSKKVTLSWTSTKQVIELFKSLNICPKAISKQTKKEEYSIDAKVLKASLSNMNKNASKSSKDLLDKYLHMKKYSQRVNTFGIKYLEKYLNPVTGKIHTNFRQIIETGRSGSSGPKQHWVHLKSHELTGNPFNWAISSEAA